MAEYPDARLGKDFRTVRCNWGQRQCGGILGYWREEIDLSEGTPQPGGELKMKGIFAVPPHINRTEDTDGALYEEPEKRRRRRKRGLRSDHHLDYPTLLGTQPGGGLPPRRMQRLNRPAGERPMAINNEVEMPVRVRCPECQRLNWVGRSSNV